MKKIFSYLIIGNGRLAKHLRFYLQSQNIRVSNWNRKENLAKDLLRMSEAADIVLIAIKDSEISSFIEQHAFLKKKTLVHFSGALAIPEIVGLHPLMTFTEKLYPIDFYKNIPFISEQKNKSFRDIFPQLENPYYVIDPALKPLYHSLCVMGGNFTTLLWTKLFDTFKEKLDLPPQILFPYLEKITENLKDNHSNALTGPIARKDVSTIQSHLRALKDDSYLEVYKSFIHATQPDLFKEIDL